MTSTSKKQIALCVVSNLIGSAIGLYLNRKIDGKLAKSENPGVINKIARWNLKVGRNPYYCAAVLTAITVSQVAVIVAEEEESYSSCQDDVDTKEDFPLYDYYSYMGGGDFDDTEVVILEESKMDKFCAAVARFFNL